MVVVGDWMRNKETQEVTKVTEVGCFIKYANAEMSGEVQAAKLDEHFDVLNDPIYQDKDAFFAWLKSLLARLPKDNDGGYTDYLKAVCDDPENFDPQDQEFILTHMSDLEGYCVDKLNVAG